MRGKPPRYPIKDLEIGQTLCLEWERDESGAIIRVSQLRKIVNEFCRIYKRKFNKTASPYGLIVTRIE